MWVCSDGGMTTAGGKPTNLTTNTSQSQLRPSQMPQRLSWDRTRGIRDVIFINIRPVTPLNTVAAASTSYTGTGHKIHEAYHKRRASM
jgi:hypothetical protein